jgi:hypothetical protein
MVGLHSVSSLNILWKIRITENGKEVLNSRNSEQVCRLHSSGLEQDPVKTSCENVNALPWSKEARVCWPVIVIISFSNGPHWTEFFIKLYITLYWTKNLHSKDFFLVCFIFLVKYCTYIWLAGWCSFVLISLILNASKTFIFNGDTVLCN